MAADEAIDFEDADLTGVRVAVLGCGALGSALGVELAAAGAIPVLWSRTQERARELFVRLEGDGEVAGSAALAMEDTELSLIAVADDALEDFVKELAADLAGAVASESVTEGRAVLHTNGLWGPSVLAPIAAFGLATGKAHPLRAVPPGPTAGGFGGASFALAGDEFALRWARRLCRTLGARGFVLAGDGEEASARLHAAASLVSGGLVALFDLASESVAEEPAAAREALLALVRSTLSNLEQGSAERALTGAIARGSVRTVERHLEVLEPAARAAYRVLGLRMLELARNRGSAAGSEAVALAKLLGA